MMARHGLGNWTFAFNNNLRRAGVCRYPIRTRPGRIELDGLGPIEADPDACRRLGGGRVDVLVRPERLQLVGPALPNTISMKIAVIVNYGDSVLVIGDARGHTVRMRLAGTLPDPIRDGATVTIGWRPADAHLIGVRP